MRFPSLFLYSLSGLLVVGPAMGQLAFQKIVATGDTLPGSVGELHTFRQPAMSKGTVAFTCYEKKPLETFGRLSIFARKNGVFHRVATTNESLIGGQPVSLYSSAVYSMPMIRPDGAIAFEGFLGSNNLLAEWKDGSLRKLFDKDDATALLGAGTAWYSELPTMTEDGRVVRKVHSTGNHGVLLQEWEGSVSILQRPDVPLPPSQTVGSGLTGYAGFRGGLVFEEWPTTDRFYRKQGETISLIGRKWNDGVPGDFPGLGGDVFSIHGVKSTSRLTVILGIRRGSSLIYGLYGWAGGTWFKIAEQGTQAPGGGTFTGVPEHAHTVSVDGGSVVFSATTTLGGGLFLYHAGTVTPLLMAGQVIDGKAVAGVSSSQSLEGKNLAISVYSADGTMEGIYTADLSGLMPDDPTALAVSTERGPGNTVNVIVPGREGYIYYLHRSTDLQDWTIVNQKMGTAGPVIFTEDAGKTGGGRAFFRVEEVKR